MPKLYIDTSDWELRVAKDPEPKLDNHGVQRVDKATGDPLWGTQVFVRDEDGGDVIIISTAGRKPEVKVGQTVDAERLYAIPWATGAKSGVAYRAEGLYPYDPDDPLNM